MHGCAYKQKFSVGEKNFQLSERGSFLNSSTITANTRPLKTSPTFTDSFFPLLWNKVQTYCITTYMLKSPTRENKIE